MNHFLVGLSLRSIGRRLSQAKPVEHQRTNTRPSKWERSGIESYESPAQQFVLYKSQQNCDGTYKSPHTIEGQNHHPALSLMEFTNASIPLLSLVLLTACANTKEESAPTYTYYGETKAIIDARCATCHQADDIASFPSPPMTK